MNPHHHLHESTLMSYAAGALQAPLSIVAGAHLEQCPHCRQRLRDAEAVGSALLEQTQPVLDDTRRETLRAAMLAQLMDVGTAPMSMPERPATMFCQACSTVFPTGEMIPRPVMTTLRRVNFLSGKGSRCRLQG